MTFPRSYRLPKFPLFRLSQEQVREAWFRAYLEGR